MDATLTELLKDARRHIAVLKDKRRQHDAISQVAVKLMFSILPDLQNTPVPSVTINHELYDGSAMQNLKIWAAGLVGNTCNEDADWMHLRFRDAQHNKLPGVPVFQKGLEDGVFMLYDDSNFYRFVYDFMYTAGWYCTAAAWIERLETERRVRFHELSPGSYWIDEDRHRRVVVMYWEFDLQACDILEAWPDAPEPYRKKLERNPYESHRVCQLVRPRKKFEYGDKGNLSFAFENLVLGDKERIVLEHSGFQEFPFLVFRVRMQHKSPWGTGPAHDMLRDAQIEQAVAETMLLIDQKLADPAVVASESLKGKIKRHPGATNYWPDDMLDKMRPLFEGHNQPVGTNREAMLRQVLERYFSIDTFLTQTRSTTAKTATEVMGIQNEQNAILTSQYATMNEEIFDPATKQMVKAVVEFGLAPQVPQALMDARVGPLQVNFTGPAATLRKRYRSVTGVEAFARTTLALKQAAPELTNEINDKFDVDMLMDMNLEGNGVEVARRDEEDVKTRRDQRGKAMALQAQNEAQMQGAALLAKAGGRPPASPQGAPQ